MSWYTKHNMGDTRHIMGYTQHVNMNKIFCIATDVAREKVLRQLLAAGARCKYALARISALTLDSAVQEVRGQCQFQQDNAENAIRHSWNDAKLREIQKLFWQSHPHHMVARIGMLHDI